jgi:hypothetical protein
VTGADEKLPPEGNGDRRDPERRKEDRAQELRDYLVLGAILLFAVVAAVTYGKAESAASNATRVAHNLQSETRARGLQRVSDERASCRRTSQKTAAEMRLNWVYWQSETQLAKPSINSNQVNMALAALSPGERSFLALLIHSGQPSRKILMARADADYDAAFAKAPTIDYRDVDLIPPRSPLGSEVPPRRWVLRAHFSCDAAFK